MSRRMPTMEPMTIPAMEPPSRWELESSLLFVSDVVPPLLAACVTVTVATGLVLVCRLRMASLMIVLVGSRMARSANCSSDARDSAGKGAIAVYGLIYIGTLR
jgi:hypothetical protein